MTGVAISNCEIASVALFPRNDLIRRRENMGKLSILKEFWDFLKIRKKWWLTPIVIVFLLLGILIVLTQSTPVAPFIYTLF